MLLQKNPTKILNVRNKEIAIFCHKNADVDALASAAMLRTVLLENHNNATIIVPEHINSSAKKLSEALDIPYSMEMPNEFDIAVLVDMNSFSMLGNFEKALQSFKGPIFLFDHHSVVKNIPAKVSAFLIDENASSTAELLWNFLNKNASKLVNRNTALLAACGIVSDTAHFSFASPRTFKTMAEALEKCECALSEILELFAVSRNKSERIALLKAAKRTKIFAINGTIVAFSEIGAFESQSATALLHLGADVAFVGNAESESFRISSRASFSFAKRYNIDLAKDILAEVSKKFNGSAGGHVTAAVLIGHGKLEDAFVEILKILRKKISQTSNVKVKIKEYR